MDKITIDSFEKYHKFIDDLQLRSSVFRGVRKYSYQVVSSIGRCEFKNNLARDERRMFKMFKETALPYLNFIPRNDFEWMAVAQHSGMPTRLLDWTYNPLVAIYFAVENDCDTDSAIFVWNSDEVIDTDKNPDPFSFDHVARYRTPHISERITNQAGLFTLHPDPVKPFEPEDMIKIRVPNDKRRKFKQTLYKYGIIRRCFFQGLKV